jgi:hypothetical protein
VKLNFYDKFKSTSSEKDTILNKSVLLKKMPKAKNSYNPTLSSKSLQTTVLKRKLPSTKITTIAKTNHDPALIESKLAFKSLKGQLT